uniref:Uncharacterized protein n=1 Tax=Nelumbo nucifera TaxID=4432 RepID=A0A822XI39_NELNU|nr:TPA_asm: hypothetical protein HUJ06_021095 [Nelumbo nucifera]
MPETLIVLYLHRIGCIINVTAVLE